MVIVLNINFTQLVAKLAFIELITEPETNVICFRIKAEDIKPARAAKYSSTGIPLKTWSICFQCLDLMVRFGLGWCLLNPFTDENIIEELCSYLQTFYDECDT